MTSPKFNSQISLGNVLQMAAMSAAILIGYQTIESRTKSNAAAIDTLSVQIEAERAFRMETDRAQEARIRVTEQNYIRSDERQSAMLTILGRIESRLQRIEERDRP